MASGRNSVLFDFSEIGAFTSLFQACLVGSPLEIQRATVLVMGSFRRNQRPQKGNKGILEDVDGFHKALGLGLSSFWAELVIRLMI